MTNSEPSAREPQTETAARKPAEPVPFGDLAREVVDALGSALRERGRLAVLEAQQAVFAAAQVVAMAAAGALLAVTAWFGVWATAVIGAASAGLPWWVALLACVIANAVAAGVLVWVIRRRLRLMSFSATLRNAALPKAQPKAQSAHAEGAAVQAAP